MTRATRPGTGLRIFWVAFAATLGLAASLANGAPEAGGQAPAKAAIQYRPPARGAPEIRVGAATRSVNNPSDVLALVPNHTGLTLRDQPVLYWHLSNPLGATATLSVEAINPPGPVVERTLSIRPQCAGLQRIDLAAAAISLKPDVEYLWHVIPAGVDRSKFVIRRGAILFTRDRSLTERLSKAAGVQRQMLLAEAGIWYDLIDSLATEAASNREGAIADFAAVLKQGKISSEALQGGICY